LYNSCKPKRNHPTPVNQNSTEFTITFSLGPLTDTKPQKFRQNTTRPTSEASSLPSFKTLKRANPAGVSKSANMVEHCRALVTPTQRDWNVGLRNHEARLQGEQRHLQLRCGASSQWGIREAAFLSRRGRSSAHARSLCCKRGACGCPRRFKTYTLLRPKTLAFDGRGRSSDDSFSSDESCSLGPACDSMGYRYS
jgi:hypothetical protein